MDELQDRLVRVGLDVLAAYGFALAGGVRPPSPPARRSNERGHRHVHEPVDATEFSRAVDAVSEAYRRVGLEVSLTRRAETFTRLQVTDPRVARTATVDLAADFRRLNPVNLSVGPVLAERDAVASKVGATFSRGEARDYIDLVGILDSGRFTREELTQLCAEVDPGFSKGWFSEALAGVDRFPDDEFAGYGVDAATITHVRETMRAWSRELEQGVERPSVTPDAGPQPQPGRDDQGMRRQRRQARQSPFPPLGPDPGLGSPYREGPGIDF